MKLKIDREADALYLTLDESDIVDSEEVSPGIIVDYNADNKVVGIEMLICRSARPNSTQGSSCSKRFHPRGRDKRASPRLLPHLDIQIDLESLRPSMAPLIPCSTECSGCRLSPF